MLQSRLNQHNKEMVHQGISPPVEQFLLPVALFATRSALLTTRRASATTLTGGILQ
jgi:hypothetical protein